MVIGLGPLTGQPELQAASVGVQMLCFCNVALPQLLVSDQMVCRTMSCTQKLRRGLTSEAAFTHLA